MKPFKIYQHYFKSYKYKDFILNNYYNFYQLINIISLSFYYIYQAQLPFYYYFEINYYLKKTYKAIEALFYIIQKSFNKEEKL